jgi:hypothetical protein
MLTIEEVKLEKMNQKVIYFYISYLIDVMVI